MKRVHIYIFKEDNNRPIIGRAPDHEYEHTYVPLNIPEDLKGRLKDQILLGEAFDVEVEDMLVLRQAFVERIAELVKHPDFNPFKEDLRRRYPKQYGNEPFEFDGVTYYLYNKGSDFYIDHIIRDCDKRIGLIDYFIERGEPMRYTFR